MSRTTEMVEAFERLVRRVLDGRVVPFVGAGISQGARIPDDKTSPPFRPTVAWMQERLGEELQRILSQTEDPDLREQIISVLGPSAFPSSGSHLQNDPKSRLRTTNATSCGGVAPGETTAEHLCNGPDDLLPRRPKLDQAADVLTWLKGATRLCDVLKIDAYARLAPLAAHRYLAYLAREGLVTEIITTNYDTCIEQAFRRSFGRVGDERNSAMAVVFNLEQYRAHAGRARSEDGDPVLHLYKINGDAADYQDALDRHEKDRNSDQLEEKAARIILTERQLQTFRDELWARDLYADRARSRSLLFCGFGSDEPQVRHHAMALMEEMQRQSKPVKHGEEIPRLPNAPFFAVWEPHLQFNQLQVLAGFALAHTAPGTPRDGSAALRISYANALVGPFAEVIEEPTPESTPKLPESKLNLPADLLFEKLFQAVWLRRLQEELLPGRTLDTWLRSTVDERRSWADWLLKCSGACETLPISVDCEADRSETRKALFGLARTLFARKDQPTLMMQWVHALRTRGETLPPSSDFYLPLREEPLLILLTLLMCLWITSGDSAGDTGLDGARITPIPSIGLRLRVLSVDGVERFVYLAKEGSLEGSPSWPDSLPSLIWLIEIPGNDRYSHHGAVPFVSGNPLKPVRIERRSAASVIRAARRPDAAPLDVLTRVFAVHFTPEMP